MRTPALILLLGALLLAGSLAVAQPQEGQDRAFVALSAEERKWLDQNRDSIILSYDAAYPPLEFQDKGGDYAGVAADIVAKVEKLLGVRFVKRPSRDWNTLLGELESGTVHLNGGMVRTPERERYAYFTTPYITLPLVIITTTRSFSGEVTWAALDGRRVGVVSGYASETFVRQRGLDRFEVVPLKNVREGLRDVSFGVIDAFVDNLATSSYYIEKDALTNLRVAGTTDFTFPLSISVSRQHPLLYSAVQRALSEIRSEDIEASRKHWISLSGEGMLSPETLRLLKLSALFVGLLLVCLAGISYYLKRRLNEKVLSLRMAQQELMDQTERLGLATEATNAGVWDFYPTTGQAYFSDHWYAMLGLKPGAVESTYSGWVGLMHPADRAAADNALTSYIDAGGKGVFEAEYRMRQADGSYRWVLGKGRAVAWDVDGSPLRLVGLNLDIQKLKTVQDELRRSEAIAKAAFDQTYQFSVLLDSEGTLVNTNQRALAFIKARPEEVLGRPFWECPWWPDKEVSEQLIRQAMAAALQGAITKREVINVDAQGNRALVDFSLSPLTGLDGTVAQFIVEGRDITESRRLEDQLRENVETLEKLFNDSPDPTLIIHEAHFVDCNNAALAILGYDRKEDLLNTHPGVLSPEFQQDGESSMTKAERMMSTAMEQGIHRFEWIHKRLDGSVFPVEVTLSPVHIRGEQVIYTIWRDITEQKAALAALQASEEKFRAIFNNAPIGIFRSSFGGGVLEANPALARMHGFASVEEFMQGVNDLGQQVYARPEDRQRLLEALLANPAGTRMDIDFLRTDGTIIHTILNAALHRDETGEPSFIDGTIEDITERKRAGLALRQSEENYRELFENAPVGIFQTTPDGRFYSLNPEYARIAGYASPAEMIAAVTDIGAQLYVRPAERVAYKATLERLGQVKNYETELKRRDGEPFWASMNSKQKRKPNGDVVFEGFLTDITERKRLELRLADQLAFQEALLDTIPYPVFYKGSDTRFIGFNKAYEEVFGVRREKLIGKRVLDLMYLPEADRLAYQAEDEAIIASVGRVFKEMPIPFADGALHQTLYSVTGFRLADGTSGGLIGIIVDITERKQAEERLRESEERYRSVIQNMQDVYYRTDIEGRLTMVSPSGLGLFGYKSLDEVLGRRTESFYMDPAQRQALLARLAAEGVVREFEILLKHKDGTPIQAATTASFYRDEAGIVLGIEGIFRDISERKLAEEALRQSEEKFSRIFEMAPECITFVRLKDAVIIDANAAFETITGHSREEAIGRPAHELGVWDDPATRQEFLQRLHADGHVLDFEFFMRRKDGQLRRVVNSAQLVPIAGEACYVSVIHDITDERRMQELLIQSEKMMSVGSLAAGIAHEINNPLGIVHQAVQNLILRTSPDQKKNLETAAALGLSMDLLRQYLKARKIDMFLEDIQAAAMRASGIIRNMLNFSRRSESRRQTCDLKRIIEQSVFLASSDYDLKKSYDFKRIEIVQDLQEVLPPCSCTETEIEQVMLNLLRNAAQAMATAHPPTPNPRIVIRLRADESQVRIEVEDNGPGMDPDVQRKAFEPFFTTKPPGVGTGLGLSVSYFIITKGHAGRMWLTSIPGKGTTFFIELPADAREDDHA